MGIVNVVSYKHGKSQCNFFVLCGLHKNNNFFGDLKICILRSTLLSLLCSLELKVFDSDIYNACEMHRSIGKILKIINITFNFKITRSLELNWEQKNSTPISCLKQPKAPK
jgi:hypothetical protein